MLLNNHDFTRLDEDVFQPVLEKMILFGGYPNAYVNFLDSIFDFKNKKSYVITYILYWRTLILTGPFDCEYDPCHLNWIIRDDRNLLSAVYMATCANGTKLGELDSSGFTDCTVINNNDVRSMFQQIIRNLSSLLFDYLDQLSINNRGTYYCTYRNFT